MNIKLNKNGKEFGAGRPNKMKEWVRALMNVLENENIIFLTDKDLILLVNRTLPSDNQISQSTFEKWKAGKFHENDEIGKEFIGCIELALIRQKQWLGEKMLNENSGYWVRYAWTLERKFSEFNLKHISENINKNEQETVINITAGSQEQKALIDNLINPEFTEIKPIPLPIKKDVEQTDNDEDYDIRF